MHNILLFFVYAAITTVLLISLYRIIKDTLRRIRAQWLIKAWLGVLDLVDWTGGSNSGLKIRPGYDKIMLQRQLKTLLERCPREYNRVFLDLPDGQMEATRKTGTRSVSFIYASALQDRF